MNAPTTFQVMINHIFRDLLDQGTVAFMDDLMVHASTKKKYDEISLEVLRRLRENRLCIAPNKCEWSTDHVQFLGYIISGDGVELTDEKIETLKNIQPVNSLKEVQCFLSFANFYRRFINDYSKSYLPLSNSTSLDPKDWRSTSEIRKVQENLVKLFTNPPILKHFDPNRQAIIETDASDYTLGAILSQKHHDPQTQTERLHPMAFHSRKFTPAEINYDTCDKELLAICRLL